MERSEGEILTLLTDRIQPYKDRITKLETSIADKEAEAIILRLAVERLTDVVKKLESGGKKAPKGAKSGASRRR